MRKVGLFFGSFNPPHIGHAIIARRAQEQFKLDEVQFIVSPHNPFKNKKSLAPSDVRLNLVKIMCAEMNYESNSKELGDKFYASNIEFELSQPSYTSETLRFLENRNKTQNVLKEKYYIIMGADCLSQIDEWKDYAYIIKNFQILLYPRLSYFKIPPVVFGHLIKTIEAPIMELSSTKIRENIKQNKSIQFLVSPAILDYIKRTKLYL